MLQRSCGAAIGAWEARGAREKPEPIRNTKEGVCGAGAIAGCVVGRLREVPHADSRDR